jgi:magnesium chelatase family protein
MARLSGPLLDRIDLHVEVPALPWADMSAHADAEPSLQVRQRVQAARGVQASRFSAERSHRRAHCNAQMGPRQIKAHCRLSTEGQELMRMAVERLGLSARAYDRILKVSRTIADLEGAAEIKVSHLAEAVQYRTLDRRSRQGAGV